MFKIPVTFENEFESMYSVNDILIGKVGIIGIYKGEVEEDSIKNMIDIVDKSKKETENRTENIEIALRLNPQDVKKELALDSVNNTVRLCVILNDFIEQDGNILVLCGGIETTSKFAAQVGSYFVQKGMLQNISEDQDIQDRKSVV